MPLPLKKPIRALAIKDDTVLSRKSLQQRENVVYAVVALLRRRWFLPGTLLLLALSLNMYRLGVPGIWFDEAFSVELARQRLPLLWHIIWGPEPNMEIYYLLLHFWLKLTGLWGLLPTEAVVRLPSALLATFSTVLLFLLGRRFLNTPAALVGCLLYALNYVQLTYAQQTRAYALQLLLLCLAWYALFTAISQAEPEKRWWWCFSVTNALACYAQIFSLLILISQVLAFGGLCVLPGAWRTQARRAIRPFLFSISSLGACLIPLGITSLHGSKTGWLPIPHLRDLLQIFLFIVTNNKTLLLLEAGCLLLALLSAGLLCLRAGQKLLAGQHIAPSKLLYTPESAFPGVIFALCCWLFVPILLSFLISQGALRLFSERYLVTIVPPFCLLIGAGISFWRWRILQGMVAGVLVVLACRNIPIYYRNAQVEDWNRVASWLQQTYQANDGIVCFDNDVEQGCQIALQYYLDAYPGRAHFSSDSPGAFSWQNFGPASRSSPAQAALDPHILASYAARHPNPFFIVARLPNAQAAAQARTAQDWLDAHYHLLSRLVTPTITISHYSTVAIQPLKAGARQQAQTAPGSQGRR